MSPFRRLVLALSSLALIWVFEPAAVRADYAAHCPIVCAYEFDECGTQQEMTDICNAYCPAGESWDDPVCSTFSNECSGYPNADTIRCDGPTWT